MGQHLEDLPKSGAYHARPWTQGWDLPEADQPVEVDRLADTVFCFESNTISLSVSSLVIAQESQR